MPGNNENPTTKLKFDISELKAGIQESNRLIKLANSEFKAAASGMDNWANSTDGLEAKIKQLTTVQAAEEKKLANLQEQYRLTVQAQGENSKGAQELAIKINNQKAAVNKVTSELSGYEDRLELVKTAQANAERSGNSLEDELRALEDAADDAGDAAEDSGDGFTILKGTLADLAASAIKGAISAVGDLVGSLMELPEATKEFRTVFGAAMQSAEDSAIGADGAKKSFEEFYKVAADEGQAAEATSHISGLVSSEEELQGALDGVIGAWVEFGDSIAVEGLAEAANETAKTGKVTGQFADALNWANASASEYEAALSGNGNALAAFKKATAEGMTAEDAFNEALIACSSEQERQQLVVATLNGLYGDNAKAYAESNSSMLDANAANLALIESQSEMATAMEPLTAAWTSLKADALEAITPLITAISDKLQGVVTYFQENETAATALKGVLIGLATALGIVATAFLISNVISAVQKAMALLNTTMLANPFVLIAAAIAGLVAAFIYLWNTSDEFRAFFENLWEKIKTAAGNAIDAVVGFFKGLPDRIKEWWDKTITKAGEFATSLKDKAKEAGTKFITTIINFIKDLPGKVWEWFTDTVQKVVDLKAKLKAKGKEAAEGLLTAIVDKVKEIPGEVLSIGKDIVEGLWDGINDKVEWIKGKIVGFKDAVLGKLEEVFDINSPSRVMRDEIGKNLALGVAQGIEKNTKYAKKSAKEMGEIIVEAAADRLDRYKVYNDMSLAEEKAYWEEVRKHTVKGSSARLEADKKYFEAKKSLNEQIAAAEKTYTESVSQAYKDLQQNIQDAINDYQQEVNSRADAIASSMSLFDEFTKNTEITGQQLISNLQSQVTGMQNWINTLDQMEQKGVDSDFIQMLRELGPSAAGEVEALNSLTADELDKYVNLWKRKNEIATDEAKKELVNLQNETVNKIASLVSETEESIAGYKQVYNDALKDLGVEVKKQVIDTDKVLSDTAAQTILTTAPTVGSDMVNGIISGLNSREGALYARISEIISSAIAAAQAAAEIASPSKIMRDLIGTNLIKGIEVGMGSEAKNLNAKMKSIVGDSIESARANLSGISAAAGTSGNMVNNYTFNQTNNSPKALSRIDLYRQTRNQFRQLQEV